MTVSAPRPHHSWRPWKAFLCLLGLTALALSLVGAGGMFRASGGFPGSDAAGPSSRPGPPSTVFCLGYVDVEGGLFYPYPTTPGRVVAIEVHEGQTVQAGDVLFRLDSTLAQAQLDEAESGVKVAESQLAQVRNALPRHKLQVAGQSKARDAMQFKLEGTRKVAARKRNFTTRQITWPWKTSTSPTRWSRNAKPLLRSSRRSWKAFSCRPPISRTKSIRPSRT